MKCSIDPDQYVVDSSLKGLFHVVAEEEKKIRTDPTARVTDLLKDVFGNVEKSRQPSLKLRLTSQRFHACRAYFAEVSYEG
jgi:hypothetical protein